MYALSRQYGGSIVSFARNDGTGAKPSPNPHHVDYSCYEVDNLTPTLAKTQPEAWLYFSISISAANSIKNSLVYGVVAGLVALVALLSGIVTIIVGYDQTIQFVNLFFQK